MTNICANCKYYLLKKYSYLPNERLCTHSQSKEIGLVTGTTYYRECNEIRQEFTMASKYGGSTYECELYAEKEPEPTPLLDFIEDCFCSIGNFFGSIWNFIKNIFKNKKREEVISAIKERKRVIKINE